MPLRPLAALLFLCLFSPFLTQAQIAEKTPAGQADYSKEAVVIEDLSFKVQFENDGTSVQEQTERIRVQSDAGLQRWGLLSFPYPSGTGSFDIEYIRVHKPDGTTVDTPLDSIQDMASEITRQAPFYSDLHEKHAPVKGLAVGDVLEFKSVERITKPLAPGNFWLDYVFSREAIVLQERLQVSVPRERKIQVKSGKIQPVVTEAGNYRVYLWSSSNLTNATKNGLVDEFTTNWQQARGRFPAADIQLSSFQSWEELGAWYRNLQVDRVKPTPEIIAKATELTKGAADDDAKERAIYNYVALQFRYIGVAFGVGRFQPHFAAEVLANQYGDCKDKHTLLAALLGAAGIKAYPALISTSREPDSDVPSPQQFNHMITALPHGSDFLWLDATGEVAPFQYLLSPLRDKHALVIWDDKPASLMLTPTGLPFPAVQNFHMDAKLDDSGTLDGDAELSMRGDTEFVLRSIYRATPMPEWKELTQRISATLGFGGEVSDVTISAPEKTDKPFLITYKYHRKDFGDWPNRRIVVPMPAAGLVNITDELNSLTVPVWLGAPEELSFHSRLTLPKAYTMDTPDGIRLKNVFGEYDATYQFRDGILTSDRTLNLTVSELRKPDFPEYQKFFKGVQNDYGAFIQLTSRREAGTKPEVAQINQINMIRNSYETLPDSTNPEALRLEQEARDAAGRQDFQTAVSSLYRSVAADPKFTRAWVTLGGILMSLHQNDSADDAFQKAMTANPNEAATRKIYALTLLSSAKFAEAVPVWKDYIKLAPQDAAGPANLGVSLVALKRYAEAAQAFETAVQLSPANASYQVLLANAYMNSGENAKAEATYQKIAGLDLSPEELNRTAYDMASGKETFPVALQFAQKSVLAVEEDSMDIDFATLGPGDQFHSLKLAAYWGTLGYVQQRLGKSDDAEKTLTAAWKLSQDGVAAAHLCELYVAEHKPQAALRMCRLARQRLPATQNPFFYHVSELIEQNDARLEKLIPAGSKNSSMAAMDEIANMRDFKLPRVYQGTATAEFQVLIEFDPQTKTFQARDSKFLGGSEKLKALSKTLTKLTLNFTSPDGNPVRIVRHGTFLCSEYGGCEFMFPDPGAGVSIPVPIRTVN
jgi:tetratricopeptide (TPR) repeat protein